MASENRTIFFYLTDAAHRLAQSLAPGCGEAILVRYSDDAVKTYWKKGERLVFIMAAGIVVRSIAGLAKDKRIDPAVVVADEKGEHWISLLGGHQGGANSLAGEMAALAGGRAVITTASDVNGLPAIDLWAEAHGLVIEDWKRVPATGTKLVNRGTLRVFTDVPLDLPDTFIPVKGVGSADMVITNKKQPESRPKARTLVLRPRNLVVGVGCNSATSADEIADAVTGVLEEHHLSFLSVRAVATIDRKTREPGLAAFARAYELPLLPYTAEELNRVRGVTPSEAARRATGAQAVAEPAALLASSQGQIVAPKEKKGNVTVAVVEDAAEGSRSERAWGPGAARKGALYVVGTGPGDPRHLTAEAIDALKRCEAVVGYGTYLDLIRPLVKTKTVVSTGMAREIERCRTAIRMAREGKTVAVVSGGDPGIYAMAGLVLELLKKEQPGPDEWPPVYIVPGISALNACAARLGAPLMHDFAAISLSDRLTAWKTIEDRIEAAVRADFVIVLYNPRSKGRPGHLMKAREILLRHRDPATPVGIVKGAMREHEKIIISDLARLPFQEVDMQTTVIIGNSRTTVWNNMMITPRGYERKEAW